MYFFVARMQYSHTVQFAHRLLHSDTRESVEVLDVLTFCVWLGGLTIMTHNFLFTCCHIENSLVVLGFYLVYAWCDYFKFNCDYDIAEGTTLKSILHSGNERVPIIL